MKTLKELQEEIGNLKDDKDAVMYLSAIGNSVPKKISEKEVEEFLMSEEGKKYMQPKLDAYHSKGLTAWQENNLEKIRAEAIASVTTVSPEMKRIAELETRLNAEVAEKQKQLAFNKALQKLSEAKMPVELAELIATNREEELEARFSKLKTTFESFNKEHEIKKQKEVKINLAAGVCDENETPKAALKAAGLL
jgi:hypothetical protein